MARPEVEASINRRLETGSFREADDVILQALISSETQTQPSNEKRTEAIDRLMSLGKKHGVTLGGMTIRELCDEVRP
jgi:hypothetical protein